MTTAMTAEIAAKLRAEFPSKAIGKKPKYTCRDCANTPGTRCCDKHKRNKCPECGNYTTTAHMHLDYIGHAETTDRLLQADPEWTWEPMALDAAGLPAYDQHGCLWIRLTVAGVSKPGYGSADGKKGPDAIKEIIGDAIRNAAMRFGVGLDLWGASGEGVESPASAPAPVPAPAAQRTRPTAVPDQPPAPAPAPAAEPGSATAARARLAELCHEKNLDINAIARRFASEHDGLSLGDATDALTITQFTAQVRGDAAA